MGVEARVNGIASSRRASKRLVERLTSICAVVLVCYRVATHNVVHTDLVRLLSIMLAPEGDESSVTSSCYRAHIARACGMHTK